MGDSNRQAICRTPWVRAPLFAGLAIVLLVTTSLPLLVGKAAGQEATTEIMVTANSDVSNGDTSSASALEANPGEDGISLREAIEVTNSDPGSYTIGFGTSLQGATIALGSELPLLVGGGVTINGDIDGGGTPDLTIRSAEGIQVQWAFSLSSSANMLHALRLRGFDYGVLIEPPHFPFPSNQTFTANTVDGLVMRGIGSTGVLLDTTGLGNCDAPCASGNTWIDTTVTGNSITAREAGIMFFVASRDERVDGVTITDNAVKVLGRGRGPGINLESQGEGSGAMISNGLIARNTVEGSPDIGIQLGAGGGRTQNGSTEGIRVVDNVIALGGSGSFFCCVGIVVEAASDSPQFAIGPPVQYLDDNVVRDVVLRGNQVRGKLPAGIVVQSGIGGGGRRNRIRDVRILDNRVHSTIPTFAVLIWTGDGTPYRDRYSAYNKITGVVARGNRLRIRRGSDFRLAGGGIGAAGIALIGGHKLGRDNLIRDVRLTRNSIRSPYTGIKVVGGIGETARSNRVVCIALSRNSITDSRKKVLVRSNMRGATGNRARVGSC